MFVHEILQEKKRNMSESFFIIILNGLKAAVGDKSTDRLKEIPKSQKLEPMLVYKVYIDVYDTHAFFSKTYFPHIFFFDYQTLVTCNILYIHHEDCSKLISAFKFIQFVVILKLRNYFHSLEHLTIIIHYREVSVSLLSPILIILITDADVL